MKTRVTPRNAISFMVWENPIRKVDLCFSGEKQATFHFVNTKELKAVDELIAFVNKNDAIIIGLEEFTPDEIKALRTAQGRDGHPLLPVPDGCATRDCRFRRRCMTIHDWAATSEPPNWPRLP